MNENQPPKNWFMRLFCSHEWKSLNDLRLYSSIENEKASLPSESYKRWECKKCGGTKKLRTL